jgi:tetratricopeptide (TPR) repeat protein
VLKGLARRLLSSRALPPRPGEPSADDRRADDAACREAEALLQQGRFGRALTIVREANRSGRGDAGHRILEAEILSAWGRHREAAVVARPVVDDVAASVPLWIRAGVVCLAAGDVATARSAVAAATSHAPNDPEAVRLSASILQAQGDAGAALATWNALASNRPDDAAAWLSLAEANAVVANYAAARAAATRSLALDPDNARAWRALGAASALDGALNEACAAFERAESLPHDDDLDAFAVHAVALSGVGRWRECRDLLQASLPSRPDPNGHLQLGVALLALGAFGEGWRQYEFRWLHGEFAHERPTWSRPHWDGQDLRGRTVWIAVEQGIGDFFQFSRYLPMLQALGAKVVLAPSDSLARIATRIPGIDVLQSPGDPPPQHDYFAFLVSLPRVFDTRVDTIPAMSAPLLPDPAFVRKWTARLPSTHPLRVGIAWAGRPQHARDRHRSMPLAALAPILDVADVQFVGLQKGPAIVQAEAIAESTCWSSVGPECDDLEDLAAVVSQLDLVVTVDTAIAHLAAVMGKPVWMMVAEPSDFRWRLEGERTDWYPTMRVMRQAMPGDWTDPVRRVAEDLRAWRDGAFAAPTVPGKIAPRDEPAQPRVRGLSRALPTRYGFLQYDPDEPHVGRSLEHYGEWLHDVGELALSLATAGATVVESSPGVGAHAIAMAGRLGADGHLLLFEPRSPYRRMLANNLAAHRVANASIIARPLTSAHAADSRAGDTIDDLALERVDGIRSNDPSSASDVIAGAQDTLWRCRPWILAALPDRAGVDAMAPRLRDSGYRVWCLSTPLFAPANFNRRDDDIFDGAAAAWLLALPEELGVGALTLGPHSRSSLQEIAGA